MFSKYFLNSVLTYNTKSITLLLKTMVVFCMQYVQEERASALTEVIDRLAAKQKECFINSNR